MSRASAASDAGTKPQIAATACKSVPGIGPQIAKFLHQVAAAQKAGQGTLPLRDVLFGITGIDADCENAHPLRGDRKPALWGH